MCFSIEREMAVDRTKLEKLQKIADCIHHDVIKILRILALKKIDFVQVGGFDMNFSIVQGVKGTFTSVLTPPNGAQAAGTTPQWKASDTSITLVPSADGLSVDATAPVGFAAATFDLTESATSSDPTVGTAGVLTVTHTITVTSPAPPLTALDFVQSAG